MLQCGMLATSQDFNQYTVVCLENRQAGLMAESIRRKNGRVLSAPAVQEIPLDKNPEAFSFAQKLMNGEIHMVIFMTGVGARYLFKVLSTRYPLNEVRTAFKKTTIVVRGPKPVQALKEFGMAPTLTVPEPNTWRELIETLDQSERSIPLKDATVAVQEYGIPNQDLIRALKSRGANVIQVPVYRWALPDQTRPMIDAIHAFIEGKAQFLFITSAVQIRHFIRVASENGLEKSLREGLKKAVIISVGPTSTETIHEMGLSVDFEPSHPKMGHMIAETAKQAKALVDSKIRITPSFFELREMVLTEDQPGLRQNSPFLKACRLEKPPYTPVWLMRQAGRYMKEYRDIRAKVPFLELCRNKELVAEVTVTAAEKIRADAAIIFSDILLIVEPLGMSLEYGTKETPVVSFEKPVKEILPDRLPEIEPEEHLPYVYEAIRLTRKTLAPQTPLIGFAGAPFTLASYVIEGGGSKSFTKTKHFMYSDPGAWNALLEKITRGVARHLKAQIHAGADAVQIFDSWAGCLSPSDYQKYVLPHSKKLIEAIRGQVPVIHFGTGTGLFLDKFCEAGGEVIGIDFRVELDQAWMTIGKKRAVQGNLDPAVLLASRKEIEEHAQRILEQAAGRPGHIFNLGHGVLPQTPVENVLHLVDFVRHKSKSE